MKSLLSLNGLPELSCDAVHLWSASIAEFAASVADLRALLSDDEAEKAARYHAASAQESSIVARGILRLLLSAYTGVAATELRFSYQENGKPSLVDSDVAFNLSHSGDRILYGFGRSRALGVDVEAVRRSVAVQRIAARYFDPEEVEIIAQSSDPVAAFYGHWTRKEAYVKARGSALFREMGRFPVPLADGERKGWFFRGVDVGAGYSAAVVSDVDFAAPSIEAFRATLLT